MNRDHPPAFDTVPTHAGGHFVLHLYAAVYRLLDHVRRLSEVGGPSLEQTFERYPFLANYFTEMREQMPGDLTWEQGTDWWCRQIITFEERCDGHLPLAALEVDFAGRLAFMIVGLVEEDSRFGTVFAELQQPLVDRRPTLELVGQMMLDDGARSGGADPWALCQPLLRAGLVTAVDRRSPRAEWVLRVPPLLWDAARGRIERHSAAWARWDPADAFPTIEELIFPPDLLRRLAQVPALIEAGKARSLVVRCDPGTDARELHGAVAGALGRGLVAVAGPNPPAPEDDSWRLLGPLCTMAHALPMIACELSPGQTVAVPPLAGYSGPVGFVLGAEGGLSGELAESNVTLVLPTPTLELRRRHWRRALPEWHGEDLKTVSERFQLSGGYIRQVARMALAHAGLDGRETVHADDVRDASRTLNRQLLDSLASRLESRGSWHDLVSAETTGDKLNELERRCRHRERLLDHLGPAFGNGANRGVRALFTGVSGTGKTLAAKILATELGMDLYRVDLAAVINKYIGETEKNLHRVLSRAEALDVVLLLDEGDALLGQRTEVKSANDRYANLETNYLLQRLEGYQGIVLVTTNLGENIDPAFQRRMDVVVPFFPPQAEERWRILDLHLPTGHEIDDAFLEHVALRCALHGGQLRNVALHASLLALDDGGGPMTSRHLEEALRSEYRKAGGTFPLTETHSQLPHPYDAIGSFVAALEGS